MLLLIDNYDSFTYNLVHYLGELGADVVVRRNDALDVQQAMAMRPSAIVLSPGPCDPAQAGICLPLVHAAAETGMPLLGVCLGHQAIGEAFGGHVVRCHDIVHGKMGQMRHGGQGLFAGLPSPLPPPAIIRWWWTVPPCPIVWTSPPIWKTAPSWACNIKRCRSTACNSTPKASGPNMAMPCCRTF